jgi:phosphoribosylanthranilate isomerase
MSRPLIKICGISDLETLEFIARQQADFVGFVHFQKSPRHVDVAALSQLINATPSSIKSVVVLVNPEDILLEEIFARATPDYIQLHGNESHARVLEIRNKYAVKIIKAIGVSDARDVASADAFASNADIILFDAKPPKDASNAGGLGVCFNWDILSSSFLSDKDNWMLSGGLSVDNVEAAIAATNAPMIDASSHLETPVGSGKKDLKKVSDFIHKIRNYNHL